MGTSTAFTPSPPISPTRQRHREQILQLAERRGWLVAPKAASVAKACHSAWKAGTLPEVSFIPSPSSSEHTGTFSDSTASSLASFSSDSSQIPSASNQIDLLCDTLSDMDFRGNKHQSVLRPNLKPSARNQRTLQSMKQRGRPVPTNVQQQQTKPLSVTPNCNSQNRRPGGSHFSAAGQNFVSSRTSPLYNSSASQVPLATHAVNMSIVQSNELVVTHASPLYVSQSNAQQLPRTTPQLNTQRNPFGAIAHQFDTAAQAFRAHQHRNMNINPYAATAPISPSKPQGNMVPRKRAVSQRSVGNAQHPTLKDSHEWLQPGPFLETRDESARKLLLTFDKALFNGSFTSGTVPKVTLEWNCRLNRTAGQTKMKRHAISLERRAVIVLSTKVIDEPARLYKTLAHELCHAAAWIIDNTAKPPHGEVFKRWGQRFRFWDHSLEITRCHDYEIHYKYNYKCVKCGKVYGRHSKSIDTSKKVCGLCKSALRLSIVS